MESLGEIIKRTLKENGIKESFVASKMNVSKQVINQIDRRKNFDFAFLKELETATGIDFTKFALIPDYLKKALEQEPATTVEEPSTQYTVKATTLAMNFEVPSKSYDNLSAFMKAINIEAEKYGIKVL